MEVSHEEKERLYKERMIVITFKMPRYLYEALKNYCLKIGESRSQVIRKAIIEFLRRRGYKL